MTTQKKEFLIRMLVSFILLFVAMQVFYFDRYSVLAVNLGQLFVAIGHSPWYVLWLAFFIPFGITDADELLPGCLGLIINILLIFVKGPVEMIKGLSNFLLVTDRGYTLSTVLGIGGLATATYGLWSMIPEPHIIHTGWREMLVSFTVLLSYYALFSYAKEGYVQQRAFQSLFRAALLIFASCFVTWGRAHYLDMFSSLSTLTKEPFSKTILAHVLEISGLIAMSIATARFTFDRDTPIYIRIASVICFLSSTAMMLSNLGSVENTMLQFMSTYNFELIRKWSMYAATISTGLFTILFIPHFHKNLITR